MKKVIFAALILVSMSCATSSPASGTNTSAGSEEAAARDLTNQMKTSLALDDAQENKVLMLNVVNLKVIRKLKETQDHEKIIATQSTYQGQMKDVLSENQFQKFVAEFGKLN